MRDGYPTVPRTPATSTRCGAREPRRAITERGWEFDDELSDDDGDVVLPAVGGIEIAR